MTAKKFIAAIRAVKVPEALDLTTDELNAIRAEAAEPFDLISLAFQCGFMRGQRATKLPADVLHLLAQADERQLKLTAQFVRGLIKKGGVA